MSINAAYKQLLHQLYALYDNREAANIAELVIEKVTQKIRTERILVKDLPLTLNQQQQLETYTQQLLQHQPVQYVLQEAWFAGMKFFVADGVLIPRPETEELVEQVIKMYDVRSLVYDIEAKKQKHIYTSQISNKQLKILDIGTGSGCIPIALKKCLLNSHIISVDISDAALKIAQKNATDLQADIIFKQLDFLDETSWNGLDLFNIIVSNPPYIKQSESSEMSKHVTSYEPSLALFVDDNNALVFYEKIAIFGKTHLTKNGQIFVEINEALGNKTVALFQQCGYQTILKQDLQGKDRIIQAWLGS